jgi:hypothetical protein
MLAACRNLPNVCFNRITLQQQQCGTCSYVEFYIEHQQLLLPFSAAITAMHKQQQQQQQ